MRGLLAMIVVLFITINFDAANSWLRRRRRRWVPPPPVDCVVSAWRPWSQCSQQCAVGTRDRTRTITTPPRWGGSSCPSLTQVGSCGQHNGGCQQSCTNGRCSCSRGYSLSGRSCVDVDECRTSNGHCDQICTNSIGSYSCSCRSGYKPSTSDRRNCIPLDCDSPSFNDCPQNSYTDKFSTVCSKVSSSCLSGTTFLSTCFLSCANDYQLAKITQQPGQPFGQDFASVDFSSVHSSITCGLSSGSANQVNWNVAGDIPNYYCRRKNDPPTDIQLNGNTLVEHAQVGSVIGALTTQDPQQGQTFTYTVQKPGVLFGCVGNQLVNRWHDPKLNGPVAVSNGGIDVTVRTTDNGSPPYWFERVFRVNIQDVNDPPHSLAISNSVVYENATVGSVVGSLSAIDGDEPSDATPHSDNFKWELVDSDGGRFSITGWKISIAKTLNHESQSYHRIVVKCSDMGHPVRSTEEHFLIDVKNVKEAPMGLKLTNSDVHENDNVGAVIGQLVASDEDGDVLSFDISLSDPSTLDAFTIGAVSCQGSGKQHSCQVDLTVKSSLDYETKNLYHLAVRANDSNGRVFSSFRLNVLNDNEKPTALNFTGSRSVPENAASGTVVGDYMIADPDNAAGHFQTHNCTINQYGDGSYFAFTSGTVLTVAVGKSINYEEKKELSIKVTCTDSGTPPQSITGVFKVTVTDVNEPPTNIKLSNTKVSENSPVRTPVGRLSFHDPEQGQQNYSFSIVGPSGVPFTLEGNQTLMVVGKLDHEATPVVDVTVRVTDSGGLFTEATFKIQVEDANDPPTDITLTSQDMDEESNEGVLVSSIVLVDEDGDQPSCTLIDSAGGRVKVLGTNLLAGPTKTNFESMGAEKKFQIKLRCSDQHGKDVVKSFDIRVRDINERPTNIELSRKVVLENTPDAVVGVVSISDPDVGQKHNCTVCEREARASVCQPSQLFTVDSNLQLKTVNSLDFEVTHSHSILLKCSDVVTGSQTSLFKEEDVVITVIDVNEKPSGVCDQPFVMDTNTSIGSVVGVMVGQDPDNAGTVNNNSSDKPVFIGGKQQLTYFLESGNSSLFLIRHDKLVKSKQMDKPQNFTINITVTDDGVIFSPNGFQLKRVPPLSVVFQCEVIVSENPNHKEILLNPSRVSVFATDGTQVGVLDTVPSEPEETFTYVLLDEKQLPFTIKGNKLMLEKKKISDFGVSSSVVSYIPLSIKSIGSKSKPLTRSFYITIDGNAKPVMCLVDGSVTEVSPPGSTVGQLLIEDPRVQPQFSCSHIGCCRDLGKVSPNAFRYFCKVDNPEGNDVTQPKNVSQLFYLDSSFVLRTRARLQSSDYNNSMLRVHFSCYDLERPLHFIGQEFPVKVLACGANNVCHVTSNCPECQHGGTCDDSGNSGKGYKCQCTKGFNGEQCQENIDDCEGDPCLNGGTCTDGVARFECACSADFSGKVCDRQESLCDECAQVTTDTLCVKFYKAAIRCLSDKYQIPILVEEESMSEQRMYEFEQEMNALLAENLQTSNSVDNRKRRASPSFYTEILKTSGVADSHTLVYLTALQVNNNYSPLLADDACAALKSTSRHCVDADDSDVIQRAGVESPPIYGASGKQEGKGKEEKSKSGGLGTGAAAGIGVVAVIAVLVAVIFFYRRKYKEAKHQQSVGYRSDSDKVDFINPVYEDNRFDDTRQLDDSAQAEMLRDRLKKEENVRHNLDPLSVRKRNDIKVHENDLYLEPVEVQFVPQAAENLLYGKTSQRVSVLEKEVFQEDLKSAKGKGETSKGDFPFKEGMPFKHNESGEKVLFPKKKLKTADCANGTDFSSSEPEPRYADCLPKNARRPINRDAIYEEIKPVKNNQNVAKPFHDRKADIHSVSNALYDNAQPNTNRADIDARSGPSPANEPVYDVVRTPNRFRRSMSLEPAEGVDNDTYEAMMAVDSDV